MKVKTEEILKFLKNEHTKVLESKEFKGNYYNYITDTIYLADKFEDKKSEKREDIDKSTGRLVMLCHECIHSIQNKYMHIMNIVLSNLSIILIIIAIILKFCDNINIVFNYISGCVVLASIVIRLFLENSAIVGSIELLKKVINEKIITNISTEEIKNAEIYVNENRGKALLFMIKDKLLMLGILLLISLI